MTARTKAEVQRLWQQLEDDARRNAAIATRIRSSGPEARKAVEELRWEAGEYLLDVLQPVPRWKSGRTRNAAGRADEEYHHRGRELLGNCTLRLLDARRQVRRWGFSLRDRPAFEAAVFRALAEAMPDGMTMGERFVYGSKEEGFTPNRYGPEEAARFIVENFSRLADQLRTPRQVRRRFHLDHRTSRLRRRRRLRDLHT